MTLRFIVVFVVFFQLSAKLSTAQSCQDFLASLEKSSQQEAINAITNFELTFFADLTGTRLLETGSSLRQAYILIEQLKKVSPTLAQMTLQALSVQTSTIIESHLNGYRFSVVEPLLRDYANSSFFQFNGKNINLGDPVNAALLILLARYPHEGGHLSFGKMKNVRDLETYRPMSQLDGKISPLAIRALDQLPREARDFYASILLSHLATQTQRSAEPQLTQLFIEPHWIQQILFATRDSKLTETQIRAIIDPLIVEVLAPGTQLF